MHAMAAKRAPTLDLARTQRREGHRRSSRQQCVYLLTHATLRPAATAPRSATAVVVAQPQPRVRFVCFAVCVCQEHMASILQPQDVAECVLLVACLPPRANIPELVIKPTKQFYPT